ncbi:MAG: nuclear transport factor 2 family protein [Pseudomonadota bacterium]|nr:nuclear transport factor 2 family protein [Pseudomonadota bacterium]
MHSLKLFPIITILLLPLTAMGEFHFQKDTSDVIDKAELKLAEEIIEFLDIYETAYNNQNYRKVKSMWSNDGNPIYIAEEVPFPLYGKSRLDNYMNPVPGKKILEGIDNRYSEVRAKYISENIAVATYRLDYDIKLVGMPAMNGWDRIMAVFVKDEGSWKMSAYAEAPMGPATMVRKMMKKSPAKTDEEKKNYAITSATIKNLNENLVSPGFDKFLEERKDILPSY